MGRAPKPFPRDFQSAEALEVSFYFRRTAPRSLPLHFGLLHRETTAWAQLPFGWREIESESLRGESRINFSAGFQQTVIGSIRNLEFMFVHVVESPFFRSMFSEE